MAKFELYKEREVVRGAFLLRALKEKNETTGGNKTINIGITEQYPPEIQHKHKHKRRELIPVMKEAKKSGNEAKLIRDKLYVNRRLYRPRVTNVENMDTEDST